MLERNSIDFKHLQSQLAQAVPGEVSIYNQAYLIAHTPLIRTHVFHPKTKNELAISFELNGDLEGYFVCYLDMEPDEMTGGNFHFFQSLYIESMNIVLGKFLTNFERETDFMSTISFPDIQPQKIENIEANASSFEKYCCSYKLVSKLKEYDCRINLMLK
ncbi:MAG: hypothetical protein CME65_09100 [Halobacteriovoraceae bacterium]|nr:hypothetical protein [Halobacteriovoraceae bacterium]|tara:strand:- start:10141 stop:10620 length:480 start_codon:yes stop_codon:yes gene_type:complete